MKCGTGCATKPVDGLIGISDAEDVRFGSRQRRKNLDLREVGILKFVDQDETGAGALSSQQLLVAGEQLVGTRDHVAERAQIFFAQPALSGGEDTGNFLAASDDLGIAQLIFRLRNPGNWVSPRSSRATYSAYFSGVTSSSWQRLRKPSKSLRNCPTFAARM